jgi:hypothetical protein
VEGAVSKLRCTCGHVIRDQTDFLRYKGRILRDYDDEAVYDAIERDCEALIKAVVAGDRESWLRRHFLEGYPRDLSNGAIFHDFVAKLLREFLDDVYECQACGRLWVQRTGSDNEFVPYMPESCRVERVLRSVRDKRHAESGGAPDSGGS